MTPSHFFFLLSATGVPTTDLCRQFLHACEMLWRFLGGEADMAAHGGQQPR